MNLIALLIFLWASIRAPWHQVFAVAERQHLLLGSILFLTTFWLMHIEIIKNVIVHPLIITSIALMVGFRLSIIVVGIASIAYLLLLDLSIFNWGFHLIINGVIPAAFIIFINHWLRKKNPTNLFFYTLGIGFICGALTIPIAALISTSLIWLFDIDLMQASRNTFEVSWILLGMFPEAFINGAFVSSITVFYPHWMRTFDEDYFLSK
ncbi:energy-coupling factor ABC transporter permease [Aliikangiella maris]|uniref:Energy-coupling factor ABC transporter permease n=2 Tax=Aliikangiella maris TaxID=3162458 RepID=A0ABV3MM00_9GAMM